VLLQIPALGPLGDLVTIPTRALHQHRQDTAARPRMDTRCTTGGPVGVVCEDATPLPFYTLMTEGLARCLSRIDPRTSLTRAGIRLPCLSPNPRGVGASFCSKSAAAPDSQIAHCESCKPSKERRAARRPVKRIETVPLQPLLPTKRPWPWLAARRPLPAPLMQS
jgi:hypothetical protein